MSELINFVARMALAYEGWHAFFNILNIVEIVKIMERYRLYVRVWLLVSYSLIDWTSIGKLFTNIYEYFFTDRYPDKSEFLLEIKEAYGPLMGQVMAKAGIILIIYRFYKSLQP
ncbi:hypothetical protein KR044_004815, partial [Drosophila immigrans]